MEELLAAPTIPPPWLRSAILGLTKEEQEGDHYLEDALQLLIELRNDARKRKDFATSDKIRDELLKAGIVLQDGPQETTFTLK